jgi:hypothetical protein
MGVGRAVAMNLPRGLWTWRGTLLVVSLIAAPQLVTWAAHPDAWDMARAASVSELVTYPVVLGAAVIFYMYWRVDGGNGTAWLACGLATAAVQGMAVAGLRLGQPHLAQHRPWLLFLNLLFAVVVLLMVTAADKVRLPWDPAVTGVLIGVLVTAVRFAVVANTSDQDVPPEALAAWELLRFAADLAIAYVVLRLCCAPPWVCRRTALAIALLSLNHAILHPHSYETASAVVLITADTVGELLLASTAVALLREAVRTNRRTVAELHRRVTTVEAVAREDRERLHEITGTVAGIASASRIIRHQDELSEPRKHRLEQMLDSELSRLERLLENRGPDQQVQPAPVDLDATLLPVIVSHQARGTPVRWEPSGAQVSGRPDDISEVVNILLNNASQHAPGGEAVISVRLMREQGGYLRHDKRPGGGAAFVAGLPDAEEGSGASADAATQ